jgi:Holliday junction resolvasome RuvABC endonuclease subunit
MTPEGRVLSFDTGAKRMGWSVLDRGPSWVDSGIMGLTKLDSQSFQEYRLALIDYWVVETPKLLDTYKPSFVANETIPLIGGGSAAMQSVLAASAVTTVQTICKIYGIPVEQIAAVTVKARIGRVKTATKPKVRDGVISLLPELAGRKSDWTKADTFDEPDAIGVALVALGYRAAKD